MSVFKEVSTNDNNLLLSNIFTSLHTRGIWANGLGTLTTFHTSSAQSDTSKRYYTQVWMSESIDTKENEMFSIAYGHIYGYGSAYMPGDFITHNNIQDTPSRAIYSQYVLSCFDGNEPSEFDNKNPYVSAIKQLGSYTGSYNKYITDFYAISFDRDKIGDRLDPGNFQLSLAELNGDLYDNDEYFGDVVEVAASPKIITLIDDSFDRFDQLETTSRPSTVRGLISGSFKDGIYIEPGSLAIKYYGMVFPEQGVILLDADVLDVSASFNSVTGSNINGRNPEKLFTSISGAASINSEYGFVARGVDIKNQQTIFVRVNSDEMNFTNNPTAVKPPSSGEDGKLLFDSFRYDPYAYITTIGLYNDNNDLLAVAKLSKPIQKSFNSEVSITVKLEY